jgi:hypothetical protein
MQSLDYVVPSWPGTDHGQHFFLHLGPPNSGKTHESLQGLVAAGGGWYLAPLRLLAFEIFDRLNQRGVPCNLLTGEEQIRVVGATVTAATIEMFNPQRSGQCVVIDEAQMLCDPARGWAWTRALLEAQAPEVHIIGSPIIRPLVQKLATAAALPLTVVPHQRLAPLRVARKRWSLEHMPTRTILVAFSRRMVLHLKAVLERHGRRVSVIYGALPPEVRRNQAARFASGETEVCIATDAVGMGLNLPADAVCFFETSKFDGQEVRPLSPLEVQQIGGRAGRYGLASGGEVGATSAIDLAVIRALHHAPLTPLSHAYIAPSVEDLACIPGTLAQKLAEWRQLHSIPPAFRGVLKPADLQERIALASLLSPEEVERLGLEAAVVLTNAPTREGSRGYWLRCAQAILRDDCLPLPPEVPLPVVSQKALEMTEIVIGCADVYLWLTQRREFTRYGEQGEAVRAMRASWSQAVDEALASQLDTRRQCRVCQATLSLAYPYGVCAPCYEGRRRKSARRAWRSPGSGRSPTRTRKAMSKGKRKRD